MGKRTRFTFQALLTLLIAIAIDLMKGVLGNWLSEVPLLKQLAFSPFIWVGGIIFLFVALTWIIGAWNFLLSREYSVLSRAKWLLWPMIATLIVLVPLYQWLQTANLPSVNVVVSFTPRTLSVSQIVFVNAISASPTVPGEVSTQEDSLSATDSLTQPATGNHCWAWIIDCQTVVSQSDETMAIATLQSRLEDSLRFQLAQQVFDKNGTAIRDVDFLPPFIIKSPRVDDQVNSFTVTIKETGKIDYAYNDDIKQSVEKSILQENSGYNFIPGTFTMGSPTPVTNGGGVIHLSIQVSAKLVYVFTSQQQQQIVEHLKGQSVQSARAYLQQQKEIDPNRDITFSSGTGQYLPSDDNQISLDPIYPTSSNG